MAGPRRRRWQIPPPRPKQFFTTRGRAVSARGGPAFGWGSKKKNNMFTVYVLKSLKNSKRYIGYTSKSAKERLDDHHRNRNKWTKLNKPFIIIHTEEFETYKARVIQHEYDHLCQTEFIQKVSDYNKVVVKKYYRKNIRLSKPQVANSQTTKIEFKLL